MLDQALFTLLHLLVFVYWLGGDLGAFYTSRYLTLPDVSPDRRLMAAKIVGDVDMAPRTALILALPTGLMLAESKGWVSLGWGIVAGIVLASLIWLAIAWKLHLQHAPPPQTLKRIDMAIRWAMVLGLGSWAIAGLAGSIGLPFFIALKLLALVGCILLGLYIRKVLQPLAPALVSLNGPQPGDAEARLAETLNRARPLVAGIWVLLVIAAVLGLWTPSSF